MVVNIINKIRKKGIKWFALAIRGKISFELNVIFYYFFCLFPICPQKIVLESEGDLSDNSFALYDYMRKEGYLGKYRVVWAVDDLQRAKKSHLEHTVLVNKKDNVLDIKRAYNLATSKYIIYDHYNLLWYVKKRRKQIILNLWHGVGYKAIKNAPKKRKEKSTFDYFDTLSNGISRDFLSDFLNCSPEKGVVLGYPRLDYFFRDNENGRKFIHDVVDVSFSKLILWMPTFRQSINPNLSEDYSTNSTGLPIIEDDTELDNLNSHLKEKQAVIILKVHHLQAELPVFKRNYSNIMFLNDEELMQKGVQLYQFVAHMDALITDYSSIAIDYLLLNRPIIFTLDDYDQYAKSRGFYRSNVKEYMPGYQVYNRSEFINAIDSILEGKDRQKEQREKISILYHKYQDGNSSGRILDFLNIER